MEAHYATVFEKNADTIPNELALICGDNKKTWREYDDRAARLASLLTSYGLASDSKVGLYCHNSNEYLEAQYSVFKIKGVPINVNYRYKEEELIYLLDNSDSEAVFFQSCYADQVNEIASWIRLRCSFKLMTIPNSWNVQKTTKKQLLPMTPWKELYVLKTIYTCFTRAALPACPKGLCTHMAAI